MPSNKQEEKERLKIIKTKLLSDNNPLNKNYTETFNKQIKNVDIFGDKDHYDLLITNTDDTKTKCECKHTNTKAKLDEKIVPWEIAVECLNLYMSNLDSDFTDSYLQNLYKEVYKLLENDNEYKLDHNLITYDEFKKDILTQTLKSSYLKELKKKLKQSYGTRYGERFRKKYLKEHNSASKKTIEFINDNETIKQNIIDTINNKLNNAFKDKDIWLNTSGTTNDPTEYSFKWWNRVDAPIIQDITLSCNCDSGTINFNYTYQNLDYIHKSSYIRFRNGINNLSLEIK